FCCIPCAPQFRSLTCLLKRGDVLFVEYSRPICSVHVQPCKVFSMVGSHRFNGCSLANITPKIAPSSCNNFEVARDCRYRKTSHTHGRNVLHGRNHEDRLQELLPGAAFAMTEHW